MKKRILRKVAKLGKNNLLYFVYFVICKVQIKPYYKAVIGANSEKGIPYFIQLQGASTVPSWKSI